MPFALFLLGLALFFTGLLRAQTTPPTPVTATQTPPIDEENYVPPWMQEEAKESEGFDWYVAPALGISMIRDTDINQFSGVTSGTTVSSGAATLAFNPGFRMDCPIGAK